MATNQLNNAFDNFDAKGNREDLHNLIALIDPEETPLYSMLEDMPVKAAKKEWQLDRLRTPNPDNAQVQGFAYNYDATTATSRVGNYNQIFTAEQVIAESQEAVDHAGRDSEVAYQKAKMGKEIRTDIEVAYLSNNASVAGSSSIASKLGGARAWLATNDDLGSTGASGGYNTGTGVVTAATNGTQRAFTKTLMDNALQAAYTAGGRPKVGMFSPYVKRIFSTFMSDANVANARYPTNGKAPITIVGAADAYLSDWGLVDIVPNQQMARVGATLARNAFFFDMTKLHKGFLRPISEDKDAAKMGDGLPIVLKGEGTFIVDNEAAHAVVADVYGMTSAS